MSDRVIKFRVWDNRQRRYLKNQYVGDEEPRVDKDGIFEPNALGRQLEQFTGLFDKNGKEIYEGDILFDLDDNYHYAVEFIDGSFAIKVSNENPQYTFLIDYIKTASVVGNIHENPELLKT